MPTLLPRDSDNNVIPAIRLKDSGGHAISAVTGSSVRNATAFDAETRVVSLYATDDVYVRFGNSSVTASAADHFFPKGVYYDFAIGGGKVLQSTHIAVLAVNGTCTLYISEKE